MPFEEPMPNPSEETDVTETEPVEPETVESLKSKLEAIEESQKYLGSHPEYALKSVEELDAIVKETEEKIYAIEYGTLRADADSKIAPLKAAADSGIDTLKAVVDSELTPLKAEIDSIEKEESSPFQGAVAKVTVKGEVHEDIHRDREERVIELEREIHETEAELNQAIHETETELQEKIYDIEEKLRKHPASPTRAEAPTAVPEETTAETNPAVTLSEPDDTKTIIAETGFTTVTENEESAQEQVTHEVYSDEDPHSLYVNEQTPALEDVLRDKFGATTENPIPYKPETITTETEPVAAESTPELNTGIENSDPTIEAAKTFKELYEAIATLYTIDSEESVIIANIEKVRDGEINISAIPEVRGIRAKVTELLETDLKLDTVTQGVEEPKQNPDMFKKKPGFFARLLGWNK